MRAMFLNLETDFPIQNIQEQIAWAISYRAQKHA
jgi:hypothetical protein